MISTPTHPPRSVDVLDMRATRPTQPPPRKDDERSDREHEHDDTRRDDDTQILLTSWDAPLVRED